MARYRRGLPHGLGLRRGGLGKARKDARGGYLRVSRAVAPPISAIEAEFHLMPGFRVRLAVLTLVVTTLLGLIGLRLWSLQVIGGRSYAEVAAVQAHRTLPVAATRGAIFDARGRLLADATGRLAIAIDAEGLGTTDERGRWVANESGRVVLERLGRLTHTRVPTLVERVRRAVARSPLAPAVVVPRISRSLAFYLDEHARRFAGVDVQAIPVRRYRTGPFGSEFLGLLGEIGPGQLKQRAYRDYSPGDVIGQSGVEATYERLLGGRAGEESIPVDADGRPVAHARVVKAPRPGRSLALTIDSSIQRAAEQAILNGIRYAHAADHPDASAGSAVVMNPRDGSVYAIASYPHFDQARAARDPDYYAQLADPANDSRPLVNRATQGIFPTGSTFKPIVAEAALSAGLITPATTLACTGSLKVGDVVFHNVEPGIFAYMNLREALAASCDTWFYRLGTMFYARQQEGRLDMQRWARLLGLGHPTGFDVPGEVDGVVPTPHWLKRTFSAPSQRIWYEGYSVNLSIGQGYLAVTPLQLAVAYSALANGGTVVRPHVGRALVDAKGEVVRPLRFKPRARLRLTGLDTIHQALYDAAHSPTGTSSAIFGSFPIPVAGKTGTAETTSGSDHSWYASWAPARNPRVVVVVLIEHGGFGAEAAAPAARDIYSAFFGVDRKAGAPSKP